MLAKIFDIISFLLRLRRRALTASPASVPCTKSERTIGGFNHSSRMLLTSASVGPLNILSGSYFFRSSRMTSASIGEMSSLSRSDKNSSIL
uniref:Putative secreted protein n=1 Tax=Ixodes ricinus TaxID=34613 RepID=A0A6B0U7D6_IXORI